MRKTVVVLALLAIAWLGYVIWPIHTLGALAQAIEAKDVTAAMHHVDLQAVRRSVTDQVIDAYLKLSGKTASPLLRGTVTSAADSLVDPVIGRIVSPDALVDLLRSGWPNAALPARPPGTIGLSSRDLGNAWQIFAAAEYGIRRFEIELPPSLPRDRRFTLEFQLSQWRWQLSGVRLPEHIRLRLAETLKKTLPR
jgi:hypothetical protein